MKQLPGFILFMTITLASFGALAQWQWLDKDGRKVFSDLAPPANVPEKSILKRPGQLKGAALQDSSNLADTPSNVASAASQVQAAKIAPKIDGIDKELADKKKKNDLAELAKRKILEDKNTQIKADNCRRAKQAKTGLDSGVRLGHINKQGEREIMDDATRLSESKRIQSIIDSDCK